MREAHPRRLSNVVFMGMGEPLANYDRVWGAVVRLHGDMGLSARHLTLSTVGVVPGIRRLAAETLPGQPGRLAARRQRRLARRARAHQPALPAGRARRGLCRVRGGQRAPPLHRVGPDRRGQRPAQRRRRAGRLRPPAGRPRQPHPAQPDPGLPRGRARRRPGCARFRDELAALGVNATVRVTRGAEIDAACGQLAAARTVADPARPVRPVRLRPGARLARTVAMAQTPSGPASYVPRCSGSSSSTAASCS